MGNAVITTCYKCDKSIVYHCLLAILFKNPECYECKNNTKKYVKNKKVIY
jgi:hypothetical protein